MIAWQGEAVFSKCRRYRYVLTRDFHSGTRTVNFIMLNPSTADATKNDPSVRRCVGFASDWGFRRLVVTNVFAYRATLPKDLKATREPVGPGNDAALVEQARLADLVVAAWGNHGAYADREAAVLSLVGGSALHHLGRTKAGHPRHPLYVPMNTQPMR